HIGFNRLRRRNAAAATRRARGEPRAEGSRSSLSNLPIRWAHSLLEFFATARRLRICQKSLASQDDGQWTKLRGERSYCHVRGQWPSLAPWLALVFRWPKPVSAADLRNSQHGRGHRSSLPRSRTKCRNRWNRKGLV